MLYISTRDPSDHVPAFEAVRRGISESGGLYVPASFPSAPLSRIAELPPLGYAERARRVMQPYFEEFEDLGAMTREAYGPRFGEHPAPLRRLPDGTFVLELWHGPTQAFKDMALQLLPRLMIRSLQMAGQTQTALILAATSGDTGKAALEGFRDVPGTEVVCFYPEGGVSDMQYRQMATQEGGNVAVVAVRGNFDDTQTGVKRLFTDPRFIADMAAIGRGMTSANSINFGRLAPQIAYYFSAYADLVQSGAVRLGGPVDFVVPTGNFGNILAAEYARRMGLPVRRLICASNRNHVLTDFLQTGVYDRRREFYLTSSPSMDILISSNLERLLFELAGRDADTLRLWMDNLKATGAYRVPEEAMRPLRERMAGGWADEGQTAEAVARAFRMGYLMDPHTAVGYSVLRRMRERDDVPTVLVSTASPYKFPGCVLRAIGENAEGLDEFACQDRLEALSALPLPEPLRLLRSLPIRHTAACSPQDMGGAVKSLLS